MKKKKQCSGHCCRDFTLELSPGELVRIGRAERLHKLARQIDPSIDKFDGEKSKESLAIKQDADAIHEQWLDQSAFISDMVIYLGFYPDAKIYEAGESVSETWAHHYTCKHLGAGSRCTIYERRPDMCRNYPNGEPCRYRGCTSVAAKRFNPDSKAISSAEDTPDDA